MSQKTEDYKRWLNALIHRLRVAPVGSTYPLDPLERELALNEIERLTAENEKMRGAFRVIDSVIPSAIPGNSDTYVKMICARFITQQETTKP